jgi:ribose transport system substrate-binding protein
MSSVRDLRGRILFASMALVVALAVAACGSSGSSSSSSSSQGGGEGDSGGLSSAEKSGFESLLNTAYKNFETKTFPGPTEPVTPPADQKITILECSAALAGCSEPAAGAKEAAEAIGWEANLVDGKGQASRYNALVQQAVSSGSDAVVTVGVEPNAISSGMKLAHEREVPLISISQEAEVSPTGYAIDVSGEQAKLGEYDAAYVALNSGGEGTVLPLSDNEYPSTLHFVEGFLREIKKCSNCHIEPTMDMISEEITTTLQSRLTGYLSSHPDVDWILSPYDPVATGAICPALTRIGKAQDIKVVSVLGVPANVELIANGQCMVADGAWPQLWNGWAGIDQLIRILAGKPTVEPANENMPSTLIDAEHIPPDNQYASNVDYKGAYEKLGGLK